MSLFAMRTDDDFRTILDGLKEFTPNMTWEPVIAFCRYPSYGTESEPALITTSKFDLDPETIFMRVDPNGVYCGFHGASTPGINGQTPVKYGVTEISVSTLLYEKDSNFMIKLIIGLVSKDVPDCIVFDREDGGWRYKDGCGEEDLNKWADGNELDRVRDVVSGYLYDMLDNFLEVDSAWLNLGSSFD